MRLSPALALYVVGIMLGMAALFEAGRSAGARYKARNPTATESGLSPLSGAVFTLMGLLVAFTFSGAASRVDIRRQLVVEEANAIGTAYLRLDLLPPASQPRLRQEFRDYVDSRIATYRALPDLEEARALHQRSLAMQGTIWTDTLAAARSVEGTPPILLLLPALNQMFDITTTRTAALFVHPPRIIFAMLALVSLLCALLAGFGVADNSRSPIHVVSFVGVLALAISVTLDLEFPRSALSKIDLLDRVLVDVRKGMG